MTTKTLKEQAKTAVVSSYILDSTINHILKTLEL